MRETRERETERERERDRETEIEGAGEQKELGRAKFIYNIVYTYFLPLSKILSSPVFFASCKNMQKHYRSGVRRVAVERYYDRLNRSSFLSFLFSNAESFHSQPCGKGGGGGGGGGGNHAGNGLAERSMTGEK